MSDPGVYWYPKGSVSALDVDVVARAFGFKSAAHLDAVLAGREPSAFQDHQALTHSTRIRHAA